MNFKQTWKQFLLRGFATLAIVTAVTACGGSNDTKKPAGPDTILKEAQMKGLTALAAAVDKAGLSTTLNNTSAQLTVFAPTDQAFNDLATKLGLANGTALVNALTSQQLQSILTYHVLGNKKTAADLIAGGSTQATQYSFNNVNATLKLTTTSGVKITDAILTDATVTSADVPASNGVIHVIDKVLVPPGVLNVVQIAQANPTFSSLVGAVVATNLQGTLSGAGPFTVFAPTNSAFAAAPTGLTVAQLTTVLTYHVVAGQVLSNAIPFGTKINTVAAGKTITINSTTPPTISDSTAVPAKIVAVDVRASNGVIHVIDKVLIPTLP
ncbi:fasciclin domain-containing protein [Undibacterium sp. Di24W]|uniref:fasciclin domain-containing protein n=1 Tax=Undibacterium sp. Di24W TaxID=3413033 RepID=UPI003BF2C810